jgi:hypothetical protein
MSDTTRGGTGRGGASGDSESERALTALEQALRDALAAATPEDVRRRVQATFPPGPVEIDTSQFHGRVSKVSVSMPEDLTAAVRQRVGAGAFSRYVAEATSERLRLEMLGEYLDELDAKYGPVPQELLDWAERQWPSDEDK